MKARYIKTMDFLFENVEIINCKNVWDLMRKIKDNNVIIINNDGYIEYINSSYIIVFELEEDK